MPDIVAVAPAGPLLGPDFITLPVKSQSTGQNFDLEVFPDANNPALRANGLPMQYYYLPKQLYLAKKPDGSGDFDFSVTLFKGLMTTEDTLGISGAQTSGGELDAGGAFVTFSMTMAVPDDALNAALAMLKAEQYSAPPARSASYYGGSQGGPSPLLGIVPIVDNHVSIEVPQLPGSSTPPTPAATPAAAGSTPAATGSTPAAGGTAPAAGGAAPAAGGAAPAAGGAAPAAGGAATPAGGAPRPATPTPAPTGGAPTATTTPAVVNNGNPWFISAQCNSQGSIEASGISSFLVTCNQLAAGAIVGSLQAGRSPFVVHYNLSEMFYINACQINMSINVDKVFMQFSGDVNAQYGFVQADLQANYQSCITSGAINTVINENGAAVDADTKSIIDRQVSDMQTNAWNLVKSEIFDWQPTPSAPASASAGACGGVAVQLKANYQMRGVHLNQNWILNETVTKLDGKDGTLTELEPAIQKNLNKYLSIIDIGQYFQKIQVAATPNIDFTSPADLADPITSASIEVSYPNALPDGTVPNNADGTPVLRTLGDGFHYTPTAINLSAPSTLAQWTRTNPTDIINISFMRLMQSLPNWDADQVTITKKLVYDPDDPRVDLSTGTPEIVVTSTGRDHTPTVGPDDVGYIYVKFVLDRAISSNVTVTLTVTLPGSQGTRTDTLQLTTTDPRQKPVAVWQVFSDKYFDAAIAQVNINVEVAPPPSNFAGTPVTWSGVQAVPVGVGRIKRIVPYTIQLPTLSDPAQATLAGQYILQAQQQTAVLT